MYISPLTPIALRRDLLVCQKAFFFEIKRSFWRKSALFGVLIFEVPLQRLFFRTLQYWGFGGREHFLSSALILSIHYLLSCSSNCGTCTQSHGPQSCFEDRDVRCRAGQERCLGNFIFMTRKTDPNKDPPIINSTCSCTTTTTRACF